MTQKINTGVLSIKSENSIDWCSKLILQLFFRCSHLPHCVEDPCDFKTQKCEEDPNNPNNRFCKCLDGYKQINSTAQNEVVCQKADPCRDESNLCGNDEKIKCISLNSTDYMCVCPKGFERKIGQFNSFGNSIKLIY